MSSQNYKFEGWLAEDASAANGNMKWKEFEPKEWEETDIDIKVTHCGICGSDLHTLRSGWVCDLLPYQSNHFSYQTDRRDLPITHAASATK